MAIESTKAGAAPPDVGSRGPWHAVAAHATRQHGYVSRTQLADLGLTREAVRHAVATGRLFRRSGGLFLVGHQYVAAKGRLRAALLAAGAGAVLSHRSAALVWRLLPDPQPLEVTAPGRWTTSAPVTIHRGRLDRRRDVTYRHGLPVTTVPRTIVDLAAVLPEAQLARAVNEAAIGGRLHARAVQRLLGQARGRRGARTLRRVLAARDRSRGWTRSTLERAFARLARQAGLPRYERGLLVDIGDGDLRECDVVFAPQRVMVELDFLPIHESGFVPYRDRRRDRRLAAAGWIVIRITGPDLEDHPDEVVADLLAALSRGGSTGAGV